MVLLHSSCQAAAEGPEWTSWTGGGRGGGVGGNCGGGGGRRQGASEPAETWVLLRPPIVESWVTRPVIVSWRLMSGADSDHVPGELGTPQTRRMRTLICEGEMEWT